MMDFTYFMLSIAATLCTSVICAFLYRAIFRPYGWTRKDNYGVAVRFKVFLPLYLQNPKKWKLMPDKVMYDNEMTVYFSSGLEWRKYNRWRKREEKERMKRQQEERKQRFMDLIFKDYQPEPNPEFTPTPTAKPKTSKDKLTNADLDKIRADLMPTPPTTGSNVIEPKPNITIQKFEFKEFDEKLAEILQEMARIKKGESQKRNDEIVRIDGAKLIPQPAEFCGDCPWASGNYPDVVICMNDHHAHLSSERCKYRKQAVLKPTKTVREGECKKCRYFQKHDKPPFGYCVRNDEITDEAYVKLCFEPIPPIAHKRPEPLGTVTTH